MNGSEENRRERHLFLLLLAAMAVLSGCTSRGPTVSPPDALTVLQAHISHGIGESPFDSPLIYDSVAAAILVRARRCASIGVLRNLAYDTAQADRLLEQLRVNRLLTFSEDQACTTFLVLVGAEQEAYARLTREAAESMYGTLAPELGVLMRLVEERGWKVWQYHFLWSQLFDSQFAWTELMQRGLVPPLGHLIAWTIYPAHPYRAGTNYYPDTELRDHWLLVSWRGDAANTVAHVGGVWETLYQAGVEHREISREERGRLVELDLIADTGELHLPVLQVGDPLLDLLRALAARYVAQLEQRIPLDSLMVLTGGNPQTAFAIAYHDISWGIVAEMVRSGEIQVPAALDPSSHARISSMRGAAAVVPIHPPFVDLVRMAIESSAQR
jgi:hypothetical protein